MLLSHPLTALLLGAVCSSLYNLASQPKGCTGESRVQKGGYAVQILWGLVFPRNEVGSKAEVLKSPKTPNHLLRGLHFKKARQACLHLAPTAAT